MSTEIKKSVQDLSAEAGTKNALEDLPAEVETLTPEAAEQVSGGAAAFATLGKLATPPQPPASGAMKTIAAAQTD